MSAKIIQISVNPSGGPIKTRVANARLGFERVEGDLQRNLKYHGGPDRAVCLFSLEVLEVLQREGHPIRPGSIGENLLISGLNWDEINPGMRLQIGDALVEITDYTRPCAQIKASFKPREYMRPWQKKHPGQSRLYARVLVEAVVSEGDEVTLAET